MSCNRENVTWKTRDGTWSIGFFDFHQVGDDHEWDVEYDSDRFHWASAGHATQEEARDSWQGSNPGGGLVIHASSDITDRYDRMAQEWIEEERKLNSGGARPRW